VVRDATTWLEIFLELNADGPDMLFGTGIKCTCSAIFRSILKTAWKSFNDYGAWAEVNIASFLSV